MLGVLTPDTFGTDTPSPDVVVLVTDAVCREFPGPRLIEVGNEPDARAFEGESKEERKAKAPSSWVMEREEYLELHNRAAQILRAHGRIVCTAGLCSGRADWLDPILPALDFDVCGAPVA